MSDTPTKVTKAKKAVSKKAAKKSTPKAATKEAAVVGSPVLVAKTIAEVLAFVGGDASTTILVSRKSLIDAKTKHVRDEVKASL